MTMPLCAHPSSISTHIYDAVDNRHRDLSPLNTGALRCKLIVRSALLYTALEIWGRARHGAIRGRTVNAGCACVSMCRALPSVASHFPHMNEAPLRQLTPRSASTQSRATFVATSTLSFRMQRSGSAQQCTLMWRCRVQRANRVVTRASAVAGAYV